MTSHFAYHERTLCADRVPLTHIAEHVGTPCFVYSETALTEAWQNYATAFAGQDHLACFALKANSNLSIIQHFARLGAGFDIVSGGELQRVLAAGGEAGKAQPRKLVALPRRGEIGQDQHEIDIVVGDFGVMAIGRRDAAAGTPARAGATGGPQPVRLALRRRLRQLPRPRDAVERLPGRRVRRRDDDRGVAEDHRPAGS